MKKLIFTGWIVTCLGLIVSMLFPEADPKNNEMLIAPVAMAIITWVYKNYNNPRYFE